MSKLQNELDQIMIILKDKSGTLTSDADLKILARMYELKALIKKA